VKSKALILYSRESNFKDISLKLERPMIDIPTTSQSSNDNSDASPKNLPKDSPKALIFPSLLAADFANLASDIARLEACGIDGWHVDVMDGHFVPNITMGPAWVEAIKRSTQKFLDIHLMIYNPYQYIEKFVRAGADRITFHLEATEDIDETLDFIHACGKQAGLAINPETSLGLLEPYLAKIDCALIMSVNPGFGGQTFIEESLDKVKDLHEMRQKYQLKQVLNPKNPLHIAIDGGINDTWGPIAHQAGANTLISGSYLFKNKDLKNALMRLHQ
jgi:ribulose-phosphate 3-epimerase